MNKYKKKKTVWWVQNGIWGPPAVSQTPEVCTRNSGIWSALPPGGKTGMRSAQPLVTAGVGGGRAGREVCGIIP